MAWSDPEINKLVTHFVAAAGEVSQLERGRDSGSRLFRNIATPHITGLQTTQGMYIVTPAGKLLTSGHLKCQRFVKFELVARGMHRGGGVRSGGGSVPMDVALTLADGAPMNRLEPRHLARYGWQQFGG